ncbi:aspartate--tRNA(Asn) ligase [Rugosimonospora africana]|uniref:Aspartate--tRNA(Asp/Asn) ligase n=1 Tax=Rugosimonospora africana TaxID=556532 RepID=A0A8J3QX40_9ACTN|nr:aspartate--tRNA(Asn) ligase [Rugosimonospora africana]GIH18754.1 aspartate--tRNA(Asp/Asn) ligase [Rugosimonospora africana]
MQRILSDQLPYQAGRPVTLSGWIHRRRLLKSVAFLILRDRAGLAQVVVAEPHARAALDRLGEETVVRITGQVRENPAAPGGFEVVQPVIEPLSDPAEPPPVELHRPQLNAGLSTLLDHAPVTLRHPSWRRVFEVSAAVVSGFRGALTESGFTEIHTPKLVASATESGANVFSLDYFGTRAYLAQSPQLYKQMMVGVFERVFEVGPVFRAEPHDTSRHLAQYTSLDAELGFIGDHRDVMAVVHKAIGGMVAGVSTVDAVVPEAIPEVHFADAVRMVGEALGEDLSAEPDLAPAHERWLGEWAAREYGSDFLFVTGYPLAKRPFYTHPEPGREGYTNSFDLLYRGVEVVTGGQRLHRYGDYLAALAERGEPADQYEPYLQAFRYGMPPHGGFAIGLERFVARLLGLPNVRQAALFPRDLHRLTP